jgi:hypothetical protein
MIKKEDNNFILILSDIGKNPERFEYLLRIIKIIIELPSSGFLKKYWKFGDVFSEEEVN